MSKKNNRAIMARKHAHDLACEKAEQERRRAKQEKSSRKKERQLAATGALKTKRKGVRIRKGVRVRGIAVVDADSKRRVLELLRREQAEQRMDVEGRADGVQTAPAAGAGSGEPRQKKRGRVKLLASKKRAGAGKAVGEGAAASGGGDGGGAAAAAPMEA